ncbi:MAG: hypothetical protein E6I44_10150 [Chloroflexi bacterium]|nr:MAG: hypothetical protein E6I44_10150 [Chloroflexota bacterium]
MSAASVGLRSRSVSVSSDARFDWIMLAGAVWLVAGVAIDGWAHNTIRPLIDTFFTPWHAILYSGYLATSAVLAVTVARNRTPDLTWRGVLPRGYDAALVGVVIFGVAGLLDMVWHIVFGIEVDVGTLLSPTHLGLAIGGTLIITGPLRAAWFRASDESWSRHLTAVVSLAGLVTLLTFMTQYASPFAGLSVSAGSEPIWLTGSLRDGSDLTLSRVIAWQEIRGIFGLLLQSGLVMGPVLVVLRRDSLRPGDMTVVLGLNALVMLLTRGNLLALWPLLGYAIVAGVVGDALLLRLRPAATRPLAIRIFAAAVPMVFTTGYFLTALGYQGGVWWGVPDVTGTIVLTGILGVLLSYLVFPGDR